MDSRRHLKWQRKSTWGTTSAAHLAAVMLHHDPTLKMSSHPPLLSPASGVPAHCGEQQSLHCIAAIPFSCGLQLHPQWL